MWFREVKASHSEPFQLETHACLSEVRGFFFPRIRASDGSLGLLEQSVPTNPPDEWPSSPFIIFLCGAVARISLMLQVVLAVSRRQIS